MKKRISIIAVVLAFLALCYVCFIGGQIDQSPHKIWLHRCNSIEKLQEKEARYPNVEVDICLRPGGVIHGVVIWKYLLPSYTKSFQKDNIHGE